MKLSKLHKKLSAKYMYVCSGFLYFSMVLSCNLNSSGQNIVDNNITDYYNEKISKTMDTSYIDYQVRTWSVRAFSTFKDHSFQIRNDDATLKYYPSNRFGVGAGLAYFPVLLDIGFNVKGSGENRTQRFDMQVDVVLPKNYIGLVVQDYKGFNISGTDIEEVFFRPDIRSSAAQLTYSYIFNSSRISAGSVFSGAQRQKKSAGSFTIGGFLGYYSMKADSSIIPSGSNSLFESLGPLSGIRSYSGGVTAGYGHLFVLPHNFFLFGNIMSGVGLGRKVLNPGSEQIVSPNPFLLRLNFRLSAGYNRTHWYSIITFSEDVSISSLDHNNRGALNIAKAKIVFGYKF